MKIAAKLALAASLALSAFSYFMVYSQYLKWRDCFNEMGRCFDSESGVIYSEQSGLAWLSIAVLMSVVSLYQIWRLSR